IGQPEGNTGFGINDYIDKMETRKVTRLTVQRFIKSRIMEGDLIEIKGTKKSRKTLLLSQNLMNTLDVYFGELNIRKTRRYFWQLNHREVMILH
ncbi:hypothetical protein N9X05_17305, partial [Paracoccaceae bacterium]|nr:hypothetical protein [Paracoccaceae bacterium]